MATGHFTAPTSGIKGHTPDSKHDDEKDIGIEYQEHALASTVTNERIQHDLQYDLDDPSSSGAIKKYLWPLDFMILPTISACYFFAYLDRGNVAVRQTTTSISQLNLTYW